jgi:geranylgeranyl diphosphate synthase type I
VDGLRGEVARIAAYHFGWTHQDGSGREAKDSWGKGVRSALVLACAQAVGGQPISAIPAAVAVELVHNASLIHDDLIDKDTMRRHRLSVWAAYGDPAAILVGNALLVAATQALLVDRARHAIDATMTLNTAIDRLIDGELADTSFEKRRTVSLAECTKVIVHETPSGAIHFRRSNL